MTPLCLALILVSLAIAWPATALARSLGRKLNALDAPGVPGQIKASPRRVPNTGGIAIFIAVALPMLAGVLLVGTGDAPPTAANLLTRDEARCGAFQR